MKKSLAKIIILTTLTFCASGVYAGASMKMAAEAIEVAPDPKKKKAGDECKVSDECQKHHACTKDGDKSVCTAPPRPKLPPGVVT